MIEDASLGGSNQNLSSGEISAFWRHLSDANLVDGNFGSDLDNSGFAPINVTAGRVSLYIPPAKLGENMSFVVFSGAGYNFFGMFSITGITSAIGGYSGTVTGISPTEAHDLDAKIDDGLPNTGVVMAVLDMGPQTPGGAGLWTPYGMWAPSVAAVSTANTCTIGTGISTDGYNLIQASGGTDRSCAMAFRFQ